VNLLIFYAREPLAENPFWFIGADALITEKKYFKISKNFENNFGVYFHILYACTQSVAKEILFFIACPKKHNF
jgi:hypothetical protein